MIFLIFKVRDKQDFKNFELMPDEQWVNVMVKNKTQGYYCLLAYLCVLGLTANSEELYKSFQMSASKAFNAYIAASLIGLYGK